MRRVFSPTVSLPDQLTVVRVAAVPIVVLLFAWNFPNHAFWATAVFVVAVPRLRANTHDMILLPGCAPHLNALLAAIPLQLLSYQISVTRGIDPDFPRNLSKTLIVD